MLSIVDNNLTKDVKMILLDCWEMYHVEMRVVEDQLAQFWIIKIVIVWCIVNWISYSLLFKGD